MRFPNYSRRKYKRLGGKRRGTEKVLIIDIFTKKVEIEEKSWKICRNHLSFSSITPKLNLLNLVLTKETKGTYYIITISEVSSQGLILF